MAHLPNSLGARDIASHSYPYNNLKTVRETGPTVVTGGNGVEVYDEDGEVLLKHRRVSGAQRSASTINGW